jgi:hypothetical protein
LHVQLGVPEGNVDARLESVIKGVDPIRRQEEDTAEIL